MPTVELKGYQGPYRFIFWSGDRPEPRHIHVKRERMDAKFWFREDGVELARNHGYADHELKQIERLVVEHKETLIKAWNAHFRR